MTTKQPVLLTVLIETGTGRWFVAGVTDNGRSVPLMCSEPGNLDAYHGAERDEQVSFLRHRLSGVLQRGCDRLWARTMKPCQIVFVADQDFDSSHAELTQQVAEHFVIWMSNPPVVFFTCEQGFPERGAPTMNQIAGNIDAEKLSALTSGLSELLPMRDEPQHWELSPNRVSS